MNQNQRQQINTAIAAGTEPRVGNSGQTSLRLRQNVGRSSYTILSRADGSMTKSGQHFYDTTGRPTPSAQFDRGQPFVKKGNGDYVKTRSGKLALVRRLEADGTTTVTRLGKLYFRGGRTEFVISVPALVTGKNARGRDQSRRTMLPVDMLGIGQILGNSSEAPARRAARARSYVLKQLAIRTQGGRTS